MELKKNNLSSPVSAQMPQKALFADRKKIKSSKLLSTFHITDTSFGKADSCPCAQCQKLVQWSTK